MRYALLRRPSDINTLCLYQLSPKTRIVNITASGKGFALVQVSYQYNLNVTGAYPLFTLDPQVDKNSNANHLQLSICSGYVCVYALFFLFLLTEKEMLQNNFLLIATEGKNSR